MYTHMNHLMEELQEKLSDVTYIKMDDNQAVSLETVSMLSSYLWDKYQLSPYELRAAVLGESIGRDIVNKKGKFSKRVASYVKKEHAIKLANDDLTTIGNLIDLYRERGAEYWVDVTNDFNWDDGQFGHDGSCYWGEYAASRDTLESYDSLCLRGYDDEYDQDGISRVWIVRVPEYNAIALFNSYGKKMTDQVSIIRAVIPGLSWKRAVITNDANDDSIPYINTTSRDEGKNGAVLWYTNEPEPRDYIDIDMETVYGDYYDECEYTMRCHNCNERTHQDDGSFQNDHFYCADCFSELFSYCDRCNDYRDANDVHRVDHHRYDHLCEYHLSELEYAKCNGCDEWKDDYIVTNDTGETYCDECAVRYNVWVCANCEDSYENEPAHTDHNGMKYCDSCRIVGYENDGLDENGDPLPELRDEITFRASLTNNDNFFSLLDE